MNGYKCHVWVLTSEVDLLLTHIISVIGFGGCAIIGNTIGIKAISIFFATLSGICIILMFALNMV